MLKSVSKDEFISIMRKHRPDNFSVPALEEMFDYLEFAEQDRGVPYVMDWVGLCLTWAEHEDLAELAENWSVPEHLWSESSDEYDYEECTERVISWIHANTPATVLEVPGGHFLTRDARAG